MTDVPAPAFDGKAFAAHLSTAPGVYRMYAADDTLLYVGKARALRNRVGSYFNGSPKNARIMSMISQIARMDVMTGRRNAVARAPVADAHFTTDEQGEVRFARAAVTDGTQKLYYRAGSNSEWILLNDEALSKRIEVPLGFSADGRLAYLQVEQAEGPDAIPRAGGGAVPWRRAANGVLR
ncbi:hypothetical protein G6F40_013819 [Rhizopus arrhizus]|nr:hypothetical protein G6F40_013819 [Rhizopus arrhizus]